MILSIDQSSAVPVLDKVTLSYDRGSLLLDGEPPGGLPAGFLHDERVQRPRAPGGAYRQAFAELHQRFGDALIDEARGYEQLETAFRSTRRPYPHQSEAVQAWRKAGRRGLVVLPTGSGKTFVAELAIRDVQRSTLVVVPTIDLMNQWYARLLGAFDVEEVGLVGGGYYEIHDLTVTTYDSFYIHAERLGNRFALVVFDECHHLPSPSYAHAATCFIAPFRLGLTATPERDGESEAPYLDLVGPIVLQRHIREMAGEHLAEYDVRKISVDLTDDERARYEEARKTYLGFLRQNGIRMNRRDGWSQFIQYAARSPAGRRALLAYREQRGIAMACRAKLSTLEVLLMRHAGDRVLIFTNDNDTAYGISSRFLIPIITHQTAVKERRHILDGIREGTYRAVVTSKVLNEGVDIPTASVAIILSGSGSVREHVQRLGRILRPAKGKQALLYEVIASDTMESNVSKRRRDHDAYR